MCNNCKRPPSPLPQKATKQNKRHVTYLVSTCKSFYIKSVACRNLLCRRIMGERKLLLYVLIVVTAIFDFMTEED